MSILQDIANLRFLTFNNLHVPEGEYCFRPDEYPIANHVFGLPKPKTSQEKWERLYYSMVVRDKIISKNGKVLVPDVKGLIKRKIDKVFGNRNRYQSISGVFPNPIKWYHVALFHIMEAEQDFRKYLGNGQDWNRKTTIVPKGRGPFTSFEAGAKDAIKLKDLHLEQDWSIGNTLYNFEKFNGEGYSKYRGINTPYLFSGTNHYTKGKYVSDGGNAYDPNFVSQQIGVAPLLNEILNRLK